MNRAGKNITIGLALGLFGVAGVAIIIVLTAAGPSAEDVLAEGKLLMKRAGSEEATAKKLEAEGRHEEANAAWAAAREKYDRALSLFREIYFDRKQEESTTLTAAYYMGLILYSRGSERDVESAVSLLQEVASGTRDPTERFESCRVIMSYLWITENFDGILTVLRFMQRDRETLLYLNEQMSMVKKSGEGRAALDFFTKGRPALGIEAKDLNLEQFSSNDKKYWKRRRLYRNVADTAVEGRVGPEAVMALFNWCCRNVVTTEADGRRSFVSSANQRLYAGHGTAEERALAFCALLEALNYWTRPDDNKRMEYEALVVKAGGNTLVAAFDGKQTCLFDMDMCLPVCGPDGMSMVPLSALRRSREGVTLNTGLEGVSYPYTAEDIKNGLYLVPFNPDAAAFRQALLLPNDFAPVALIHRPKENYRPLYENVVVKCEKAVRRHFSRKVKKFDIPYKDPDGGTLDLWKAPFELNRLSILSGILNEKGGPDSQEITSLKPEERKRLDELVALNEAVGKRVGPLQAMREDQMKGKYKAAIRNYKDMIIENPGKAAQKELLDDAKYFMGLALLESARRSEEKDRRAAFEEAKKALQTYLETCTGRMWYDSARYHLALAYLELGEKEEARNQLEKVKGSLNLPAKILMQRFDTTAAN